MNILDVELYTSPELLEKAFSDGHELALDYCVVDCLTNSQRLPGWAILALVERSKNSISNEINKTLNSKRFHSLVMAAVQACEDSGIASGDNRFSIAESLLSITNVRSKNGSEFSFDNIKKIYNRNKKSDTRLIHGDAFEEFMLIIKDLPHGMSIEKIEMQIEKLPTLHITF